MSQPPPLTPIGIKRRVRRVERDQISISDDMEHVLVVAENLIFELPAEDIVWVAATFSAANERSAS